MFFKLPLLFFVGLYFFNINSKSFIVNKCMNLYMKRDKISNLNVINKPRGFNQKIYSEYLDNSNNSIIVAVGPAGTGKTMFACIKAIKMLKSGQFNKKQLDICGFGVPALNKVGVACVKNFFDIKS